MQGRSLVGLATTFLVGVAMTAGVTACGAPDADGEAGLRASGSPEASRIDDGSLYGRITLDEGRILEGRLRWGGDEEGLWSHTFNGFRPDNPWIGYVEPDERPRERVSLGALGIEVAWDRPVDLGRPFMARFGDIVRIDASRREIRVTLKSGTTHVLDRFAADDFADGLRVWDAREGWVDLGEWGIRSVEFLPGAGQGANSRPLWGTVRSLQGTFTGLLQWDREAAFEGDALSPTLTFGDVRSIVRASDDASMVTLRDGREVVLSGTRRVGHGNRGVYVDDPRFGRVLVSWDAFEGVEFRGSGAAPTYADFPAGRPLSGRVTTRAGRHLVGRLVFDLDESETTETLDAPIRGVDYLVPFGDVASIDLDAPADPRFVEVVLRNGEELHLERAGDLGSGNAGLLLFASAGAPPEYVPWDEVRRIDLDRR